VGLKNLEPIKRQWDAFFKEVAPYSHALRREVAACLKVPFEDLEFQAKLDNEYRSSIVAHAIQHDLPLKEFRVDGLFKTKSFPAFGYEYQRTFDLGLGLRVLMYEIAIRETLEYLPANGVQFVILYSGRVLSKARAERLHGKMFSAFSTARFLDLNQIDMGSASGTDLHSLVLALAREDAGLELFLAARDRIIEEDLSYEERGRLTKAVLAAALGRPDILDVLRKTTVDAEFEKSLELVAGAAMAQQRKEVLIELIPIFENAPAGLEDVIGNWKLDETENLVSLFKSAAIKGDWNELLASGHKHGR
jgi:hypothetical protein